MVGQAEWKLWHEGKELQLVTGTDPADVSSFLRLYYIINVDLNISVKLPLKNSFLL